MKSPSPCAVVTHTVPPIASIKEPSQEDSRLTQRLVWLRAHNVHDQLNVASPLVETINHLKVPSLAVRGGFQECAVACSGHGSILWPRQPRDPSSPRAIGAPILVNRERYFRLRVPICDDGTVCPSDMRIETLFIDGIRDLPVASEPPASFGTHSMRAYRVNGHGLDLFVSRFLAS